MCFFLGLFVQNKNTGCPPWFSDHIVVLPYQLYGEKPWQPLKNLSL